MRLWILACLLFTPLVLGCGDDDEESEELSEIAFAAPGPLNGPAGVGSFRFGAATAATQIEDQNPNTDWYVFTQPKDQGGLGKGTFVGEATKGYTKAIEDIELLKSLKLDSYRFSIEWGRVEPKRDQIDEAALKHYSDLIDALIAAGIRPMITVHHFSNPIWVDDPRDPECADGPTDANLCGFGHPQGGPLVIAEMAEHAQLLAERFGDRVDEWATLNEPVNYLLAAYGVGYFPPGKKTIFSLLTKFVPVVRDYLAGHAAMYAALKAADTKDADGDGASAEVGLTLAVVDWTPARDNVESKHPDDVAGRDRVDYVFHQLVVDSLRQGKLDADLDGTPEEDQPTWKGTLDWLGVQYYFRAGVTANGGLIPVLQVTPCFSTFDFGSCVPPKHPSYCVPTMGYEHYPQGLFRLLTDYAKLYPDLPLVVTEGGIATELGERRAENVVRALEQIERARDAGADVRGYYHWSLYDNFEWAEGFEPRFGLYRVEPSYERTPTLGADVLAEIAGARRLTPAQREKHGGSGAMTPEGSLVDGLCAK